MPTLLGVISDTHGLLRPQARAALEGCDIVLHAGDVGDAALLSTLAEIAPVRAVRGNCDIGAWAACLPEVDVVEVEEARIVVVHDRAALRWNPVAAGAQALVFGHSHHPLLESRNGVLHMNPGSAGPRRFSLPVGVGRLVVDGARVRGELIRLAI